MATINVKLPDGTMQPMYYPDDWSQDQIKEAIYKHFPQYLDKGAQSDGQDNEKMAEPVEKQEKTGFKGLASDVLHSLGNALKNGKGFLKDIPNNLEKSGKDLEAHPFSGIFHMAGQLGAGAAELGKGLINAPHDLNQYLGKKKLLPESLVKAGQYIPHIPEDTGLEKLLGTEADPSKGDSLIRTIPEIASVGLGGASLVKAGRKAFKAPDLKNIIKETQAKVNTAETEAGKIFDTVEKEVGARRLSNIPIDKDVIKQAESFLAKTPANKELIKRAKTGDYQALRALQSDLRVKGEKSLASALAAENKMGEEIFSTRDQINSSIEKHLTKNGHEDLANLLNKARGDYRTIKQTYFSTPQLAKVFGKSQKIPKNPMTLLTEDSTEMNKFLAQHPEVKEALTKALKHKKNVNVAKVIGGLAGVGTSAEIAHRLIN